MARLGWNLKKMTFRNLSCHPYGWTKALESGRFLPPTHQQTRPAMPTSGSRASLAHKPRQRPWKLPLPKARKESWPTQQTLPPKPPFLPPEKNLNISGTSGQIGLKFEINDFQKFVLPPSWLDQSSRVKSILTSDSPADKTSNADSGVPRKSGTQVATTSVETSVI